MVKQPSFFQEIFMKLATLHFLYNANLVIMEEIWAHSASDFADNHNITQDKTGGSLSFTNFYSHCHLLAVLQISFLGTEMATEQDIR